MKIFIVGIVASGKTTVSKHLSKELQIEAYELDVIVHPVIDGVRKKRTPEEQIAYINHLDKQGDWIIEGTYRKSCHILLELADKIIFLDPPLKLRKRRVLTRFIKQQLKVEACHYKSNLKMLKMMYKWTDDFEYNRSSFEQMLNTYYHKLLIVNATSSQAALNHILQEGETREFISIT